MREKQDDSDVFDVSLDEIIVVFAIERRDGLESYVHECC